MKNYIKIKNVLFLFIILSIFSCDKEDSNSDSKNGEMKYLSTLVGEPWSSDYPKYANKDTLVYNNGKVTKSYLGAGCTPFIEQYEYGNNGKISKVYRFTAYPYDWGYEYQDMLDIFESSALDNMSNNRGFRSYQFAYDSQNRLIGIGDGNNYANSFEYDDQGRLYKSRIDGVTYTVLNFDDKGNPLIVSVGNSETTYQYSNLKNPYYDLFQKYGLIDINCALAYRRPFISPNVVTSVGGHNYLYYFDGEGEYPTSVNYSFDGFYASYDFTYH